MAEWQTVLRVRKSSMVHSLSRVYCSYAWNTVRTSLHGSHSPSVFISGTWMQEDSIKECGLSGWKDRLYSSLGRPTHHTRSTSQMMWYLCYWTQWEAKGESKGIFEWEECTGLCDAVLLCTVMYLIKL